MDVINILHLTKKYSDNKGIFDISLSIKKGEVYGYLGPNGAGKSTTMRHLMGFIKADSGDVSILGLDCWSKQKVIQQNVGYLPGEIAFSDDLTGLAYLKLIAKMRKMTDFSYALELLEYFEINADYPLKQMSKGMKQKIGIVSAFMHKPQVLLLDEPTSGLDPLMQTKFINLVLKAKERGASVILSSHIFEEVEKVCDRVGMIRNGKLIKEVTIEQLSKSRFKTYVIGLNNKEELNNLGMIFKNSTINYDKLHIKVSINDSDINKLISELVKYNVRFIKEQKHTLEEYFMQFYGGDYND